MSKWITKNTKSVYKNKFLEIFENEIVDPNGNPGIRNKINIGDGSVVIVAEDSSGGLYMVGQERYAVDEYSKEFISGGIKKDEKPLEAAKRELAEEVGLEAEYWKEILVFNPMNSMSERKVYVYIAKELKKTQAESDDYEKIDIIISKPEKIVKEILNGNIKDALTICSLFAYLNN